MYIFRGVDPEVSSHTYIPVHSYTKTSFFIRRDHRFPCDVHSLPILHTQTLPFFHSSILPYTHSSILSYIQSPILPYTHSSIIPYTHSFIHPFIHSTYFHAWFQEPIQSSAHICRFADMTVKSVLMDQILQDPENPSIEDHLLTIDIKVHI